ncbi:MAG: PDZ domain-containing protein, partial [Planctomycetota bacterium]
AGIVSGKGRSNVGLTDYEDFIQTDAAINPGNSGGPLIDIQGRVIGINTAIASRSGGYQGVGFTIPVNMAKAILEQLLKSGRVVRGWLGVALDPQEMSGEKTSRAGALVKSVTPGGPAEKGGIAGGDVIVAFDGRPVEDGFRLRLLAADAAVGKTVPVKVLRDGKEVVLDVTIVERTAEVEGRPVQPDAPEVGITAKKLTPELAARFKLPLEAAGVVVMEVAPGSLAEKAGVKPGHILRAIDGRAIETMADLNAAVSGMDVRAGVKVVVEDASGRSSVVLRAR